MVRMARRICAMLGIVVVVGLALTLMWRVYLHHRAAGEEYDEPGVIASARKASGLGPTTRSPRPEARGLA
jgi:hypothetical protein